MRKIAVIVTVIILVVSIVLLAIMLFCPTATATATATEACSYTVPPAVKVALCDICDNIDLSEELQGSLSCLAADACDQLSSA